MERVVDLLGKMPVDPRDLDKVFNASTTDSLKAAEMTNEVPASFTPNAGDCFEQRSGAGFLPALPVTRDRKPMRFVPNLLDEMQRGRIRR